MQPLIRHLQYAGILLFGLLIFSKPIWQLAQLSLHNELYSHFMLIPMVSLFFLWTERRAWSLKPCAAPVKGLLTMAAGIACYAAAFQAQDTLSRNDFLAICLLGAVIWIHGGFVGVYGPAAYRQARFPLYLLAAVRSHPVLYP